MFACRMSALHLAARFAAPQHLSSEPGSLSLRGGVAAARALIRATQQGRREAVEFVAEFPCATAAVPSLLNVTANGRLFCSVPEGECHSLEGDLTRTFGCNKKKGGR